jgi:GNAT superfamily N-acetyltransferase
VELCARHASYEGAPFPGEGSLERLRTALFSDPPKVWGFVAEVQGAIVGYATCTLDFSTWRAAPYLHLDCLFLEPAHRNRGLGAALMRLVAGQAAALGCRTLEWQTPAWNVRGARFYQRLGARSSQKLRFSWSLDGAFEGTPAPPPDPRRAG